MTKDVRNNTEKSKFSEIQIKNKGEGGNKLNFSFSN